MDLKLGSNAFRKTNGILVFQGKEQIVLELQPETQHLLLTMDLYDAQGTRIAHLRRNAWVFDKLDQFRFSSGPEKPTLFTDQAWLKVTLRIGAGTVFEAHVVERDVVAVPAARFHTHAGQLVEISEHFCRIAGGAARFGDVLDLRGGPVRLE